MKLSDNDTYLLKVLAPFVLLLLFLISQITKGGYFSFITNCEIDECTPATAQVTTCLNVTQCGPKSCVTLFDESHDEVKEELKEISPMTWGTGTAIWQSDYPPYGSNYGKAYSSCWWNENVFTIDCYALARAQGGIYQISDEEVIVAVSDSGSSGYMMPEPTIRIKSDIYSEGTPVYFKIKALPVTIYVNINSDPLWPMVDSPKIWQVEGPEWANFTNWNLCVREWTDYVMTQIGNNIHFGTGAASGAGSYFSSYQTSELGFYYSNEVDVRALSTNEYSIQPFGQKIPMKDRREFTGVPPYHGCGYAAMAMIVDYWAQKYSELKQPTQDAYYQAFDKCRDVVKRGISAGEMCVALDRYFKNENNCRSGGRVPLNSVRLDLKLNSMKSSTAPIIVFGSGTDAIGDLIPKTGHFIVLDGMYSCSTTPKGGSKEYWFAVRDTWPDDKKIVSQYWYDWENYTNFNLDGMNWWNVNPEKTLLYFVLYVPSTNYYFSPSCLIKVDESSDIIDDISFDRDLDEYDEQEIFDLSSPNGAMEIVYEEPQDPNDDENGRLRISAPALSWAEVTFPTFVPSQAKISFDYTVSPLSTLRVYINTHQIGMFQGGPLSPLYSMSSTQDMSHAKLMVDLTPFNLGNSYVDLIFHVSGTQDNEVFLDNLIVKNSGNILGLYDLNNDGEINFIDFAVLANEWDNTGDAIESDLNNDHCVDMKDLSLFVSHWLY